MTKRKTEPIPDDSENIQTPDPLTSEGVVDAKSKTDPDVDDELGNDVVISTGDVIDTSAHSSGGATTSPELTTVPPVVQREEGDLDKTGNPYTIVDAGSVRAKELVAEPEITHAEWQAESAPEQKGASMLDPNAEKKDYLYSTEFLHGIGIETCSECGDQLRTDTMGHIICGIASPTCPRLAVAEERVDEAKKVDEDQASDRTERVEAISHDPDELISRRDEELRDHAQ